MHLATPGARLAFHLMFHRASLVQSYRKCQHLHSGLSAMDVSPNIFCATLKIENISLVYSKHFHTHLTLSEDRAGLGLQTTGSRFDACKSYKLQHMQEISCRSPTSQRRASQRFLMGHVRICHLERRALLRVPAVRCHAHLNSNQMLCVGRPLCVTECTSQSRLQLMWRDLYGRPVDALLHSCICKILIGREPPPQARPIYRGTCGMQSRSRCVLHGNSKQSVNPASPSPLTLDPSPKLFSLVHHVSLDAIAFSWKGDLFSARDILPEADAASQAGLSRFV